MICHRLPDLQTISNSLTILYQLLFMIFLLKRRLTNQFDKETMNRMLELEEVFSWGAVLVDR